MADEPMVEMFDAEGKRYMVPRSDFANFMLPDLLKAGWDDAEKLFQVIMANAAPDLSPRMEAASLRLLEIDKVPERAALARAVVQMTSGALPESEKTLREAIEKLGPIPVLRSHLARSLLAQNRADEAAAILGTVLDEQPNFEHALAGYAAMRRSRGGDADMVASLEGISRQRGAWLPQLWLARIHLDSGRPQLAIDLYRHVLRHQPKNAMVLTSISGDLCVRGHTVPATRLLLPLYRPEEHGPHAGINLTRALYQMRQFEDAGKLLERLEAAPHADVAPTLAELRLAIEAALPPPQG